jgi:hypothetical protein
LWLQEVGWPLGVYLKGKKPLDASKSGNLVKAINSDMTTCYAELQVNILTLLVMEMG